MATILTNTNGEGDQDVSVVTDTNNNGSVKPVKLQNLPASYRSAYFLLN